MVEAPQNRAGGAAWPCAFLWLATGARTTLRNSKKHSTSGFLNSCCFQVDSIQTREDEVKSYTADAAQLSAESDQLKSWRALAITVTTRYSVSRYSSFTFRIWLWLHQCILGIFRHFVLYLNGFYVVCVFQGVLVTETRSHRCFSRSETNQLTEDIGTAEDELAKARRVGLCVGVLCRVCFVHNIVRPGSNNSTNLPVFCLQISCCIAFKFCRLRR